MEAPIGYVAALQRKQQKKYAMVGLKEPRNPSA